MKRFLAVFAAFLLVSCATMGNDSLRNQTPESIASIITEGVTTQAEVEAAFGIPIQTTFTDARNEVWKYTLTHTTPTAQSFIPVVGVLSSGATGTQKELTILFDDKLVVQKYTMTESPIKIRTGVLNQ